MNTHLLSAFRKSQLLFFIPIFLICWIFGQTLSAQMPALPSSQGTCSGTFAGLWQLSTDANTTLNISFNGNNAEGSYAPPGQASRVLRGRVTDTNYMQGEWGENLIDITGRSGTFIATLVPAEQRLNVTLYIKQVPFETTVWNCGGGGGGGARGGGGTGGGGGGGATSTPTPLPSPTATPIRDDQDQDNFQTFDSLTPEQQVAVLTRRGPRMRVEYNASDFSMRLLVKNGSHLFVDYALKSDRPAELTLTVGELRPIYHRLKPTDRDQISLILPRTRGAEFQVAKLNILSLTSADEPAEFELYGLAVGERGLQALNGFNKHLELATNRPLASSINADYEPLQLFLPLPESGLSLQIKVDLPATLKVKQKPENRIVFSCTSGGDFSDGRWEWWRVRGLEWLKVWQHGTGGLSRNQTKSEDWNGIITSRKLVSVGSHALQMTAWQKAGSDRDSVVARAPARLAVIE